MSADELIQNMIRAAPEMASSLEFLRASLGNRVIPGKSLMECMESLRDNIIAKQYDNVAVAIGEAIWAHEPPVAHFVSLHKGRVADQQFGGYPGAKPLMRAMREKEKKKGKTYKEYYKNFNFGQIRAVPPKHVADACWPDCYSSSKGKK